jgi:uncharacterized membrane protein YphA (DoxX/SURF4 family)
LGQARDPRFQTLTKVRIASLPAKHAAKIECGLKHGGGLMLVIGWKALFAAAVLFLFIIPTTLAFHAFWRVDPEAAQDQMLSF